MASFLNPRHRASGTRGWGLVLLMGLSFAFGSGCGNAESGTHATGGTTSEGSGGSTGTGGSGNGTSSSSTGTGTGGGSSSSSSGTGTGGGSSSSSSGTGTGGGSSSSSSSSSSGMPTGCTTNGDCAGDPAGAYCDTSTGLCVACLPADPTSCTVVGEYCDDVTFTCQPGCDASDDCTGVCDLVTHQCVECAIDDDCALGTVCQAGTCVSGCSASHGCPGATTCCNSACVDLAQDLSNCGSCGQTCTVDHATPVCAGAVCTVGVCDSGYEDCDQDATNGCEVPIVNGQTSCVCTPGEVAPCYSGPLGTENVGVCKGGTKTCASSGTSWGSCMGEVLPSPETCVTPDDDDCNGMVNEGGAGCVCTPNATGSCYTGPAATRNVGACKDGTWTCNADGTAWGPCMGEVLPVPETCATPEDDNCDGQVNEAGGAGCVCEPNSVKSCYSGPPGTAGVGVCKAGTQQCDAQGLGYGPCTGGVVPSPDVCTDNLDNDCNGTLNDGFSAGAAGCACAPGSTQSCYSGPDGTLNVGICKSGTQTCNANGDGWGPCTGDVTPAVDDCTDNLDNDCDGTVNDGYYAGGAGCACIPLDWKGCYTGPAGTLGVGPCTSGITTCNADGKAWGACVGQVLPSLDSCLDSVDNDCNGVLNDGNHLAPGCACTPGATKCTNGQQVYCDANGDWGPPAGPCVCTAGQYKCNCDQVLQCDIGPPAKWVPLSPNLVCTASQRCDEATGTCKALSTVGTTTPTGTYYQFATFTTSNSVFKGGYDVDSYGDYIYVNRGGSYLDVYKVTLQDTDGDGLLEPNQHPSDPGHQGPMEKRVLTFIQTYTKSADLAPMGPASTSEIYVTADAVYSLGPTRNGDITKWVFATKTSTIEANSAATFALSHLGFGAGDQKWYGSNESARKVYSFCPAKNMWVPEFLYPNLAGGHMDGLEVIVNPNTGVEYVYVSDMTSDYLAQYRKDAAGNWVQENVFKYSDATGSAVEGLGFGVLNHFWATGGSTLYEIGGGDLTQYLPQ